MKYTAKLRLLILIIAVLPPLVIISYIKLSTELQIENEQKIKISQSTQKAKNFILSEQGKVKYEVQQFLRDSSYKKIFTINKRNKRRNKKTKFQIKNSPFDFLYIINTNNQLIYSQDSSKYRKSIESIKILLDKNSITTQTDRQRTYAALSYVTMIDSNHYIYAGRYIDHSMVYLLENISDASITISFKKEESAKQLDTATITSNGYQEILLQSSNKDITITLEFLIGRNQLIFSNLFQNIIFISLVLMLIAILFGLYITKRTKKEIDNLRLAFANVANGNFDTTVMAYEQSEFSELADSFSEMVRQLKTTQQQLTTVEKIAAWETVGQKLAHEIKNPLSPISIAADDLRSSYYEKLPNFDTTLDETTSIIKKEVKRMTQLLDEFVSFARMKQSELHDVEFGSFIDELKKYYSKEILLQKLLVSSSIAKTNVELDRDTFMQLCINLIKNGFETSENAVVKISIAIIQNNLQILVSDNGTGFSEAKLANSFRPFETTKKDGSGLGLVICHRIILDHKGTMVLQNSKDKGGEVVITLPIL